MTESRTRGLHIADGGKSCTLQGDGLSLRADVFGLPDAAPVLFFHGGGQSRRAWRGAASKVAAAGFRAVTVDLRGHGESDWSATGDYDVDAYARDIERLLDGFDQPTTLVGASRGGQAAFIAASRHPDRTRLVLLADVAPAIEPHGVEGIREFLTASLPGFASVEEAADSLAHFLHRPRVADAGGLAAMMRPGEDGRLYWLWDPLTAAPRFLYPPSERAAMEAAARGQRSPTVMVRGSLSQLVTPDSVRHFRSLMPTLEVVEIAGAGHMFTGDQNDAFADRLIARLQTGAA